MKLIMVTHMNNGATVDGQVEDTTEAFMKMAKELGNPNAIMTVMTPNKHTVFIPVRSINFIEISEVTDDGN